MGVARECKDVIGLKELIYVLNIENYSILLDKYKSKLEILKYAINKVLNRYMGLSSLDYIYFTNIPKLARILNNYGNIISNVNSIVYKLVFPNLYTIHKYDLRYTLTVNDREAIIKFLKAPYEL